MSGQTDRFTRLMENGGFLDKLTDKSNTNKKLKFLVCFLFRPTGILNGHF